jgi:hypothetical protein
MLTDGGCELHPGSNCELARRSARPHLAVQGLPCQPFRGARTRNGTEPRTGPTDSPTDFITIFQVLFNYLEPPESPHGFLVEEVDNFYKLRCRETGRTYSEIFVGMCKDRGYFERALTRSWPIFRNSRLYIVGLDGLLGGQKAVDWINARVEDI